MSKTHSKHWPADAVIVVAANKGEELRHNMLLPVPAECRDCGADLIVDQRTLDLANAHRAGCGRPVECLCPDCTITYDPRTVDAMHDMRKMGSPAN